MNEGMPIRKTEPRILVAEKKSEDSCFEEEEATAAQKHPIMEAIKADSKWKSFNNGIKTITTPRRKGSKIFKRLFFTVSRF